MADADILVNFDVAPVNTSSFAPAVNGIRGGRWKDRFKAKKRLQGKQAKGNRSGPNSINVNRGSRNGFSRSQVPASQGNEGVDTVEPLELRNGNHAKGGKHHDHGPRQELPVISSIFSSNPTPSAKQRASNTSTTVTAAPTNAPLQDGSAFATMGLTPTLASHLVNKLGLEAPTSIQQTAIPQLISTDSDAFIQAETGSGKTLTYLLPMVNRIISASLKGERLHRDSGCFGVILAPTRELGRQIHSVLLQLLSHPSLHWLVPILILGGEKKKSEKARIRKGGNIIVATPGRLADHLANTTSLDVSFVKWLVLDEGDRLMELGFEETLQQILDALNSAQQAKSIHQGSSTQLELPERRITILCSATMKPSVQKLGDMSLKDALYLKGNQKTGMDGVDKSDGYKAPAQLKQAYIVVAAKLRLVSLASILRRAFVRKKENMKVIVFFSCADSVDFHYEVFCSDGVGEIRGEQDSDSDSGSDSISSEEEEAASAEEEKPAQNKRPALVVKSRAPLIDSAVSLFKLHGSLTQQVRTATINQFFHEKGAAVLFCTDVASRGLDLPNVDLVVQYDPPYSKEDYIHRIGRTARAGRDGRAILFLLPGCEEDYPNQVLQDDRLTRTLADDVLKKGFGNAPAPNPRQRVSVDQAWKKDFMPKTSGEKWEQEAIEFHLDVERRVLASNKLADLAKKAFQSHIRAYATHVAAERNVFDIKQLHLGHLAKSFGLRDRPGDIKVPARGKSGGSEGVSDRDQKKRKIVGLDNEDIQEQDEEELLKASQRMRKKMREHMDIAAEFNIG
ncbi:hypothetical protein ABW19_dt0208217 [Dactylella cylindrospora]|nr:hypothetical protein ABW19_dt0208217 [Dactylella cylindrospora]